MVQYDWDENCPVTRKLQSFVSRNYWNTSPRQHRNPREIILPSPHPLPGGNQRIVLATEGSEFGQKNSISSIEEKGSQIFKEMKGRIKDFELDVMQQNRSMI